MRKIIFENIGLNNASKSELRKNIFFFTKLLIKTFIYIKRRQYHRINEHYNYHLLNNYKINDFSMRSIFKVISGTGAMSCMLHRYTFNSKVVNFLKLHNIYIAVSTLIRQMCYQFCFY